MKWLLVLLLASGNNATPDRIAEGGIFESRDACLNASHAARKVDKDIRGAWCVKQ